MIFNFYLKTLKSSVSNEHDLLVENELKNCPFSIENNTNKNVPIHQLKVLRYLRIEGICETLLYGNVYEYIYYLYLINNLILFKISNLELHFKSLFES